MGKFKWLTVIFLMTLFILGPIGLLFVPSWSSKLDPMLNLVTSLFGSGGEEKISLAGFSFVETDETTLTLRLDLGIDNSDGGDMVFPALNLTLKYGSSELGYGWVNPEVFIPAGSTDVAVPIYAKMYKGDAFNQFLLSMLGGGLSLSIGAGEAFVFLETFGGIPAGAISIPLPSRHTDARLCCEQSCSQHHSRRPLPHTLHSMHSMHSMHTASCGLGRSVQSLAAAPPPSSVPPARLVRRSWHRPW